MRVWLRERGIPAWTLLPIWVLVWAWPFVFLHGLWVKIGRLGLEREARVAIFVLLILILILIGQAHRWD